MRNLFTSLFLLSLIASCYTEKKAAKHIDKANRKQPQVVAEKFAQLFPITADTIYKEILSDSVRFEFIRAVDTLIINTTDTIVQNRLIKAKEIVTKYKPVEKLVRVVDSANSKAYRLKAEKLERKAQIMNWWLIGLLHLLVIILLILIFKK
jgi:tetrahydromethanopterin S-methyltransferase subunit G